MKVNSFTVVMLSLLRCILWECITSLICILFQTHSF